MNTASLTRPFSVSNHEPLFDRGSRRDRQDDSIVSGTRACAGGLPAGGAPAGSRTDQDARIEAAHGWSTSSYFRCSEAVPFAAPPIALHGALCAAGDRLLEESRHRSRRRTTTSRSVRSPAICSPRRRSPVWVVRAFPIVVVDEFQDSKGGQLAMISSLSSFATCVVAADDFQDLENTGVNPAVAWARTKGESESLIDIHRTSASGLLEASRALRAGGNVPHTGDGFRLLGALNHNVGASFVSRNLTWWRSCADIAVITPVRPFRSAFVRDLIARVEEKPISNPPWGPHHLPWEESQEEECDRFIGRT